MAEKGLVSNLLARSGAYPEAPTVVSALANQVDRVRVVFDQEMVRGVGEAGSVRDHTAYNFQVVGGTGITPASTLLVQEAPTIVEVLLNEGMTQSAAYTVFVTGVKSILNEVIDPNARSAEFVGYGTDPQVESATAISSSIVRVQFDKEMLYDSELEKAANYVFSGITTLTATSVSATNTGGKTHADVTISGEMRTGAVYNVEVSNVSDLATNPIDTGNDDADFTGVGRAPRVEPTATVLNYQSIRIVYDERVNAIAETVTPYSILPLLGVVSVTKVIDDFTYLLTTEQQATGVDYVVSIDNTVEDLAGNPIDSSHDTASFVGAGFSPPEVWMSPEDGSENVRMRTHIGVTCRDVEEEHTGINVSTLSLKVSYVTDSGATLERVVVAPGDLQYVGGQVVGSYKPGFTGEITGDPLDQETGITFRFIPVEKWIPRVRYTVHVLVQDNESSPNTNLLVGTFWTALPVCFEDALPARTELDDTLIAGFPTLPNCDALRAVIMQHASRSSSHLVRARTLMHLATKTDMRTLVAGHFDYSLVDDIQLCDRNPILSVKQVLDRYGKHFIPALNEIPRLTQTAKDMVIRYYRGSSPVYTVNAVAVTVLLAAVLGDS